MPKFTVNKNRIFFVMTKAGVAGKFFSFNLKRTPCVQRDFLNNNSGVVLLLLILRIKLERLAVVLKTYLLIPMEEKVD